MKITRKDFLRLSGLGLLAVAGGKAVRAVAERSSVRTSEQTSAPPAKRVRWGMAIDLQKCRQKDGCDRCIKACHSTHNVPQFADRAHGSSGYGKGRSRMYFPPRRPATRASSTETFPCCCCATTATILPARTFARSRQPGNERTAWSPSTFIAASAVAIAWLPARMVRAALTGWIPGQPSDRKSTRLNSSHVTTSRMPSSA